jgi:hypothetical protein
MTTRLAASVEPSTVEAALLHVASKDERPVNYTYEPPPGVPWRTGNYVDVRLPIRDARPLADQLSIDVQGFQFLSAPTAFQEFQDAAAIKSAYHRECEALIRRITGASRALAYDHNVRSGAVERRTAEGVREVARRVHGDFTAGSGPKRARDELEAAGLDADRLLKHRFALINVWRPIRGPVVQKPLALCDARTVAPDDLVLSDLLHPGRKGEIYSLAPNPAHRWYYVSKMRADEVLLIKCFDSDRARASFTPHGAFDDPNTPADAPPRQSIEVRVLAVFAPDA